MQNIMVHRRALYGAIMIGISILAADISIAQQGIEEVDAIRVAPGAAGTLGVGNAAAAATGDAVVLHARIVGICGVEVALHEVAR